ncbi:MAG: dihydroneopterin aldolase [Octadecabacter sp.]|nr:dihydroneopterin aldolase [Octadecabacter sp.]
MTMTSSIELRDMILATDIGTYGPDDPVPDNHLLDLTLDVAADRVMILQDGMAHVFDYDPLIADIKGLAKTGHRETQEWLMTQIVQLCAKYPDIHGVDISLRKFPVDHGSGTLGVRLAVDHSDLTALRASA